VTSQKPGQTDGLPYPTAMTQWVRNNVDHNLQTTDGQGTFHGMGLIAVSVPLQGNFAIQEQPVKRLSSKLPVSALVADRGIPILSYDRPGRCGLQNVTMTEISELKRLVQVTLPLLAHLDTLWHLKWFFKHISNLWPNWVGYMQTTCTGAQSVASVMKMLPVIDMKPTDSSCIYSTLCFVVHQAKQLNIPTPAITFGQPLWLKTVEISKAAGLDIACRLRGFHVMKSFLRAIGTVMAGSGIEELLRQIYGSDTVVHMLHSNAVFRAVRGH